MFVFLPKNLIFFLPTKYKLKLFLTLTLYRETKTIMTQDVDANDTHAIIIGEF